MPAAIDQAMDPQISEIVSLQGIRKRASKVLEAARAQELTNFTYKETLMSEVEDLVTGIIAVKITTLHQGTFYERANMCLSASINRTGILKSHLTAVYITLVQASEIVFRYYWTSGPKSAATLGRLQEG